MLILFLFVHFLLIGDGNAKNLTDSAKVTTVNDHLCRRFSTVLCVKDVLDKIQLRSKQIIRTALDIEKEIFSHERTPDMLNQYVHFLMAQVEESAPTHQQSSQFFHLNNIDKNMFINLLTEMHFAMSYLYNSINSVLEYNDIFKIKVDKNFSYIRVNLEEIICNMRHILDTYSCKWSSVDQAGHTNFTNLGKDFRSPTFVHNVHSVILVKLLRGWMTTLDSVFYGLESKII
ncbi:hypothetical protein I4U23_016802 [Adineta vaga]|nr:hypothetical protein I4U23_016802 [Adineta vaga]